MTDTSREAVEALIADLLKPSGVDMQVAIEQAADALAALLDERDKRFKALMESNDESIDRRRSLDAARQRILDLEAERDELQAADDTKAGYILRVRAELESMRGKRDRARQNGDRYRLRAERAEAERDGLAAKLDAVKAWLNSAGLTSIYGRLDQREQQELVAILADTNEGNGR